jgi:transposase
MEHIVGIDLHASNGYYGIIDATGKRVFQKRLANDLVSVLSALQPYKETITSIVVESTYNWYWLVDGLKENGYPVQLANPGGFKPYRGLKHADDKSDAFFLTELKRHGILPEGHIYPKEERPIRDLVRRRMFLVQQRTSHLLSFQALLSRQTGKALSSNAIRKLPESEVQQFFDDEHLALSGEINIALMRFLSAKILHIEQAVLKQVALRPEYKKLKTVPGIGDILAVTIMLETGAIDRFAGVGNYASYCRCVKSIHTSNQKKKGEGNRKNGNKYLEWAYVEAANFARRFCPQAQQYYQRKLARTNKIVATKSLAAKLCKASYFIMRDQVAFKVEKIFG